VTPPRPSGKVCTRCADFAPTSRPRMWGTCESVAAKHGLYHPVVCPLAVRADFGCVHWRERPEP
jgi:hypothetical protein